MSSFRSKFSMSHVANDDDDEKGYNADGEAGPLFDDTSQDDTDENLCMIIKIWSHLEQVQLK